MREFKFRAWDKQQQSFDPEWALAPNGGLLYHVGNGEFEVESSQGIVIEHYTGLKDKNGKEIYEGDILLVEDDYTDVILDDGTGPLEAANHLSAVVYDRFTFGVKIEESANMYSTGFHSFEDVEGTTGLESLEVIGNIHENPELLEVT